MSHRLLVGALGGNDVQGLKEMGTKTFTKEQLWCLSLRLRYIISYIWNKWKWTSRGQTVPLGLFYSTSKHYHDMACARTERSSSMTFSLHLDLIDMLMQTLKSCQTRPGETCGHMRVVVDWHTQFRQAVYICSMIPGPRSEVQSKENEWSLILLSQLTFLLLHDKRLDSTKNRRSYLCFKCKQREWKGTCLTSCCSEASRNLMSR